MELSKLHASAHGNVNVIGGGGQRPWLYPSTNFGLISVKHYESKISFAYMHSGFSCTIERVGGGG